LTLELKILTYIYTLAKADMFYIAFSIMLRKTMKRIMLILFLTTYYIFADNPFTLHPLTEQPLSTQKAWQAIIYDTCCEVELANYQNIKIV
ncbi:MAG TPA: hypothetical protein VHA52_01855, partial [Candidatus Babeliaceae bacterium]|nr:hypothetical protein [Candidatus Babeliaceae bacterium]